MEPEERAPSASAHTPPRNPFDPANILGECCHVNSWHRYPTNAMIQCWIIAGPASTTLGQQQPSIGSWYRASGVRCARDPRRRPPRADLRSPFPSRLPNVGYMLAQRRRRWPA